MPARRTSSRFSGKGEPVSSRSGRFQAPNMCGFSVLYKRPRPPPLGTHNLRSRLLVSQAAGIGIPTAASNSLTHVIRFAMQERAAQRRRPPEHYPSAIVRRDGGCVGCDIEAVRAMVIGRACVTEECSPARHIQLCRRCRKTNRRSRLLTAGLSVSFSPYARCSESLQPDGRNVDRCVGSRLTTIGGLQVHVGASIAVQNPEPSSVHPHRVT